MDSQEEEVNTMESTPPEPSSPNLEPENHYDRGMLVVDETLLGLVPFLEDQQFSVQALKPGMADEVPSRATAVRSGIGYLLGGRTLVTNRAEVFRQYGTPPSTWSCVQRSAISSATDDGSGVYPAVSMIENP
jgi:hypothetical protein